MSATYPSSIGPTNVVEFRSSSALAQQIHLTPANGIAAGSYAHLCEYMIEQYSIKASDTRNNWPQQALPDKRFDWHDHAEDLINTIESNYSRPVIGMGHSMGATVTAMAAIRRPELFSKLVLIEPATAPSRLTHFLLRLSPAWLINQSLPFIKKSHYRQFEFDSTESFVSRYRNHPTYRRFTERAFSDLVKYGLVKNERGQMQLACHPHWESHNFRSVEYIWKHLAELRHPTLVLRAEHTYLYSQAEFDRQCAKLSNHIKGQLIPGAGHLAPHELPEKLSQQMCEWLNSNNDLT